MLRKLLPVPVSYFSMVLGLSGLGLAWRYGAAAGLLPSWPGEALQAFSALLWGVLAWAYAVKWRRYAAQAKEELNHAVQCCFISLFPVGTLLVGISVLPYWRGLAWLLLLLGIFGQLLFAAYRCAGLWRGLHTMEATTPIVYLPPIATNFVSASALGAAGYPDVGLLFFGAGMFSWMGLEATVLHRLRTFDALPPPLRPVIGILLAPAFVGCNAWLAVNGGVVDALALCLMGYGLLQFLYLLRLFPWVWEGGFSVGLWAYSFGLASMAACGLRLVGRPGPQSFVCLGWLLFWIGTSLVLWLLLVTIRFFYRRSAQA